MPTKIDPSQLLHGEIALSDQVAMGTIEEPSAKFLRTEENKFRKGTNQPRLPRPKDEPDVFGRIYQAYLSCFPLPDEQESRINFESILQSNVKAKQHAEETGEKPKEKEMWVYLRDRTNGKIIGASNFDIFAGSDTPGVDGTIHGIYMFVSKDAQNDYRKQGWFKKLVELREQNAKQFIQESTGREPQTVVTFAEQNSPLLMTGREYLKDSEQVLDQCERRIVFDQSGFSTLKFPYAQPRLSPRGGPCTYLDIVTRGYEADKPLPSALIQEHFRRFFELSFPEGTDLDHKDFAASLKALKAHDEMDVLGKGIFHNLQHFLSIDKVKALPEEWLDKPLWQAFPRLTERLYGKDAGRMVTLRNQPDQPERGRKKAVKEVLGHYTQIRGDEPGFGVFR